MPGSFALWDTGGMFTVEIYARSAAGGSCRRQEPAGGGPEFGLARKTVSKMLQIIPCRLGIGGRNR